MCTLYVLFFMVVTDCTFQLEMSPLNVAAFLNIPSVVIAAPTFHVERSQLNAAAPANTENKNNEYGKKLEKIPVMYSQKDRKKHVLLLRSTTAPTFHVVRLRSNDSAPANTAQQKRKEMRLEKKV